MFSPQQNGAVYGRPRSMRQGPAGAMARDTRSTAPRSPSGAAGLSPGHSTLLSGTSQGRVEPRRPQPYARRQQTAANLVAALQRLCNAETTGPSSVPVQEAYEAQAHGAQVHVSQQAQVSPAHDTAYDGAIIYNEECVAICASATSTAADSARPMQYCDGQPPERHELDVDVKIEEMEREIRALEALVLHYAVLEAQERARDGNGEGALSQQYTTDQASM
ncbi:hypothetical protein PCL_03011 [Purpureocillium lilacinum]|uniref:Uncharacterized protein n=1 Tax=Purpureocillium lilacinum TaxID=33203 RepID=A0A2U3DNU1_PURLI|nr:hypothetical protein PCL_03011 [Purpureocillium lilacinum]